MLSAFIPRSFLTLLRPFQTQVWASVFVLLILAPFGLFAVARGLGHIFHRPSYLSTLGNSAWFTYGSFLGETVGANFELTTSMRYH